MKALYRWIEEKAQSGMDAGMLSERLTMLGMEVEECHKRGGVIEGLMVGEVLTCEDHPDSDHLHVCRVLVGGEENTIVCGAENVRAKIKVVVATIGTTLPGDFKIKKAKIRGVESRGMICSKEELGLEEKSKGIWILPDDTKTGSAGPEILGEEDWLMALAVTSNRSDCLSINGLAREAAAAAGKKYCPSRPVLAEKAMFAPAIRIDARNRPVFLPAGSRCEDRTARLDGEPARGMRDAEHQQYCRCDQLRPVGIRTPPACL